tara:strand:- start:32 stop:208 length:177 start_codon:yes stop_codon:yes gene_type:complete
MTEKIKDIASRAPPITSAIEPVLKFMESHIRKPLEGTWFDQWIATPTKKYYIAVKRRD